VPDEENQVLKRWMIGLALVVVIGGLATWFYLAGRQGEAPVAGPISPAKEPAPLPAAPATLHPLPAAAAPANPLPELNDSDVAFGSALAALVGAGAVEHYLLPDNLIRRIVVTVDNLPRQKVAMDKRAAGPVPGHFEVSGDELHATMAPANAVRYQPLVASLRNLDMHAVGQVYFRFYPLFQRAYEDLGYPTGYFNDRLVAVIDDLLAAPQTTGAIALVRPNVMYQFADPALESRSAGQKILLRMGAENAATVKAKLLELRSVVTGATPKQP
jgi:hypothetical protein